RMVVTSLIGDFREHVRWMQHADDVRPAGEMNVGGVAVNDDDCFGGNWLQQMPFIAQQQPVTSGRLRKKHVVLCIFSRQPVPHVSFSIRRWRRGARGWPR